MLLFYSEDWSWWYARTGWLDLTQADAAKSQIHKHNLTLKTPQTSEDNERLHHCITTVLTFAYQQELYQTRKSKGSGNSRWQYQTLWKDPSDSKFNSETEKQELQGFVYWDMITCPLSLSSPKKQLELPRNWQSWYGCAELSSSTPKPSLSTNWRSQGALSCHLSDGFFLVTTCTRCKRQDAICKVAFPGSPLSGWSHTKPADLHNALWFCFFTLEKRSSFENVTWGLKALLWQTVI